MSGAPQLPAAVPLTVIAGPTASGKTALAVRLAKATGAEIVNADSQQVYRYFDVGTAKPSPQELSAVPHHLISVIDPNEQFSAAEYQRRADAAIAEIAGRGKRVLVVGGTGLYLRVLLRGVVAAVAADTALRRALEEEAGRSGREALHRRLEQVDPAAAARISPRDLVRIIRALEIHQATGTPASALRAAHGFAGARYPYELFVLNPPREALYQAIAQRTRQLYAAGLLDEVRSLVARGYEHAAPMRSVGYKQALAALRGELTQAEALAETERQTRRFAKRQLTWFRREPAARFLAPPYAEIS